MPPPLTARLLCVIVACLVYLGVQRFRPDPLADFLTPFLGATIGMAVLLAVFEAFGWL